MFDVVMSIGSHVQSSGDHTLMEAAAAFGGFVWAWVAWLFSFVFRVFLFCVVIVVWVLFIGHFAMEGLRRCQ